MAGNPPENTGPHPPTPIVAPPRAVGVILVGMSVAIWWPAFTLGAWGTLFFEQILTVWVAATAALVVVLAQRKGARHRVPRAIALFIPSVWLILAIAIHPHDAGPWARALDVMGGLVSLFGVPATIWVLARIIWPEFARDIPWSGRVIVGVTVIGIAVISYELGVHNASFLTCGDFTISGNSQPPGCFPDDPGIAPGITSD